MHKFPALLAALFVLTVIVASPPETRADAVEINGGMLGIGNTAGAVPVYRAYNFDLIGNNFRMVGGQVNENAVRSGMNCVRPCVAGSTFSLSSTNNYGNLAPNGRLTLDGHVYTGGYLATTLTFNSGPATIPLDAPTDQSFTLTTTFTMTGTVGFTASENTVPTGFKYTSPVFGAGFADISLFFSMSTHQYEIGSINYRFEPAQTPEPATMFLLGTGLAGAAATRRRRRSRRAAD